MCAHTVVDIEITLQENILFEIFMDLPLPVATEKSLINSYNYCYRFENPSLLRKVCFECGCRENAAGASRLCF